MRPSFYLTSIVIAILLFASCSKSHKKAAAYTDSELGDYLAYSEKYDSAFLVYNRYITHADDSLKKGAAFKKIGEIQHYFGDLYGAQESLVAASHILDSSIAEQREEFGYTYNTLGNVSIDLHSFDEAIEFFNTALNVFKDSAFATEVLNGKATALQKMGKYDEAISIYDSILYLKPSDELLVARAIDNRARTKWLQDPDFAALPAFDSALKIRNRNNYSLGLNASYAHLSDYYAKSNHDSALWFAQKMRGQAMENRHPDDVLEATDKLIRLSNLPRAKNSLYNDYRKLNDSLQFSRDTTRSRFAMIKYDFQKSKADNLSLKQHITRQEILLLSLIAITIFTIVGGISIFRKRRNRTRLEAEKMIQESKLKTSQKVHDVVANSLYRLMNELEHTDSIDKELLLNNMEDLYEQSRDISYEDISSTVVTGYDRQVHDLLNAYSGNETNVHIVGNQPVFWNNVSSAQKKQLQLVLNEMMINMKKHSRAKNVVIVFKQEANQAQIIYKDDGIGLRPEAVFKNGLENTVSRINSLKGEINFGKTDKGGMLITILFPLELNTHD